MSCEVTYGPKVSREFSLAEMEPNLSAFELQAIDLEGKSYKELASQLGKSTKSVDNALQRVKRKLEEKLGMLS